MPEQNNNIYSNLRIIVRSRLFPHSAQKENICVGAFSAAREKGERLQGSRSYTTAQLVNDPDSAPLRIAFASQLTSFFLLPRGETMQTMNLLFLSHIAKLDAAVYQGSCITTATMCPDIPLTITSERKGGVFFL